MEVFCRLATSKTSRMSFRRSVAFMNSTRSDIRSDPCGVGIGRRATGFPTRGIDAIGSFSCGGSVLVNPSLT
jgi:hypothetical protein